MIIKLAASPASLNRLMAIAQKSPRSRAVLQSITTFPLGHHIRINNPEGILYAGRDKYFSNMINNSARFEKVMGRMNANEVRHVKNISEHLSHPQTQNASFIKTFTPEQLDGARQQAHKELLEAKIHLSKLQIEHLKR